MYQISCPIDWLAILKAGCSPLCAPLCLKHCEFSYLQQLLDPRYPLFSLAKALRSPSFLMMRAMFMPGTQSPCKITEGHTNRRSICFPPTSAFSAPPRESTNPFCFPAGLQYVHPVATASDRINPEVGDLNQPKAERWIQNKVRNCEPVTQTTFNPTNQRKLEKIIKKSA